MGPPIVPGNSGYYFSNRVLIFQYIFTLIPLLTPAEEPNLTAYNVTFIISSPSFQDIELNSSNQTSLIENELNDLFKNSSINATFFSCRFQSLSMVDGDSSTVTAMCSFKNDSTIQEIDRVLVYHVFENKSKDASTLGPYTLDKDSLHVNDYHEDRLITTAIPLVTPTEEPKLTDYNVTFTISSPSFQDIESNSSNQTRMIVNELEELFKNSSINATFSSCRFHSLNMVDGDRSTVTAMCSFKNDSTIQDIDRVLVYHVFENKTKDVLKLGRYTLDKNSLYVNDYHEVQLLTTAIPLVTPTEEPKLTDYNLTFIISSPSFQDIESNSSNLTGMIVNELNELFKNSSINATFSSCRFHSLNMVDGHSSTVTAMCSFKNDSTIQDIDRVLVYRVFENKTNNVSKLGPYTLDKDSLHINDYHEAQLLTTSIPPVTPSGEPKLTDYNVTFVISTPSFQDMESNSSNQTSMIANELDGLFKNSSINATFSSCRFHSFSMVDGDSSTVTAMCSFKNDSTIQDVDRVLVYHVFENQTKDISKLGPYTLDKDSLYVNAALPRVTPTAEPSLVDYNVTCIISSPSFQDIESNSSSHTRMIVNELDDLFENSSINITFSRCRFHSFSMVNGDSSAVTAICSFRNDSTFQNIDRVLVYHVFENKTKDVSKLGPYTLDNDSLYVNAVIPVLSVTTTPEKKLRPIDYNVTFIINRPGFQQIQSNSILETVKIGKVLNELFKNSSIKATFSRCSVHMLSNCQSGCLNIYIAENNDEI
ncbi:mucin-16-like [Chiloscyllium plagiosum]|uniref:mucin-16-like n=1 Tax=Chiloscyllium plagiosum TaxID=36176 RepID=UPI001CB8150F|nr:mucin-16-like [Chiloscyllium plagiosum]